MSSPLQESVNSDIKNNRARERGVVHITGMEKDLLQWALNRFLPSGPKGFKPRPGNNLIYLKFKLSSVYRQSVIVLIDHCINSLSVPSYRGGDWLGVLGNFVHAFVVHALHYLIGSCASDVHYANIVYISCSLCMIMSHF